MSESRVYKRTFIAGMELNEGDPIEIGLGRQRIVGTFKGFDRFLFAFVVETDGGEIIIPYKSLKYIIKRTRKDEAS